MKESLDDKFHEGKNTIFIHICSRESGIQKKVIMRCDDLQEINV